MEASYIGYNPQQVKVGSQTRFQFVLEEVANTLDDIVVVGYSSQKKETVTGSISMVTTRIFYNRRKLILAMHSAVGFPDC